MWFGWGERFVCLQPYVVGTSTGGRCTVCVPMCVCNGVCAYIIYHNRPDVTVYAVVSVEAWRLGRHGKPLVVCVCVVHV